MIKKYGSKIWKWLIRLDKLEKIVFGTFAVLWSIGIISLIPLIANSEVSFSGFEILLLATALIFELVSDYLLTKLLVLAGRLVGGLLRILLIILIGTKRTDKITTWFMNLDSGEKKLFWVFAIIATPAMTVNWLIFYNNVDELAGMILGALGGAYIWSKILVLVWRLMLRVMEFLLRLIGVELVD